MKIIFKIASGAAIALLIFTPLALPGVVHADDSGGWESPSTYSSNYSWDTAPTYSSNQEMDTAPTYNSNYEWESPSTYSSNYSWDTAPTYSSTYEWDNAPAYTTSTYYEPATWSRSSYYVPTTYAYDWRYSYDWSYESPTVVTPTTPTTPTTPSTPASAVCNLRVSDRVIARNTPVLLTWNNSGATDMKIHDQYGNVIISSGADTSIRANSGRQTVIPNQDVTYTMKVRNSNGTDTCSVSIDVQGSGNISVDRVPLTAVPYTGFDAGPTMTALFYLLLGVWAVAIAYYLMRRKYGGVAVVPAAVAVDMPSPVVATAVASPIPNLPTDDNFAKIFGNVATEQVFSLAQYAAQEHVFVTDEVITAIQASAQTTFAQKAMFDALVAKARSVYPAEHGWLTIDSTRYAALNA